jgi:hypothetical protein
MFFVFGMNDREHERGLVADGCARCRALRFHAVIDHVRVVSLYFIPLGKGRRRATLVRCESCGLQRRVEPLHYAATISRDEARAHEPEDVVAETTPLLAQRLAAIAAATEPRPGTAYRDDATIDVQLERARALLREVELAGEDSSGYVERFARSAAIGDRELRELVAELSGYVAHLRRAQA